MISIPKISMHLIASVLLYAVSIANTIPIELEGIINKISPPNKNLLIKHLIEKHEYNITFRILIEANTQSDLNGLAFICSKYRYVAGNFLRVDASISEILKASKLDYVKRIYIMDHLIAASNNTKRRGYPKVLIGLVDIGMDWKSECFIKENSGETRILWYWDQDAKSTPESSLYEGGVPYGLEFSRKELQNILVKKSSSPPLRLGHGWIMAVVAAGNAHIKNQDKTRIFRGSLLSAPIIMVNTTARKSAIFDAVAYIVHKAGTVGAKCVINFSYSKHFGPHNESQTFVKSIDSILNENSILVVPSGNDRMSNVFTCKKIKMQTFIEFQLEQEKRLTSLNDIGIKANIELWYQGSSVFKVMLISPDKEIIGPVASGKSDTYKMSNGIFHIANTVTKAVDKWHGISITLGGRAKDGDWKIKLVSTGIETRGLIKGWVTDVNRCNLKFENQNGMLSSASSLAFGKEILSVGAVSINEDNKIVEAVYSSRIGVGNGTLKPDVLTIGTVMVRPPEFNDFFTQQGTSVSSALITRLIACIWEKRPDLRASSIRSMLKGKVVNLAGKRYKPNLSAHYQMVFIDELIGSLERK